MFNTDDYFFNLFILQVCFDHKPRIISKTNKDDFSLCSHPVTKHVFEEHKYVASHSGRSVIMESSEGTRP